jgi:hypothetical protein
LAGSQQRKAAISSAGKQKETGSENKKAPADTAGAKVISKKGYC